MENAISYLHTLLKNKISKNDICVDMTMGNGNDTLLLANLSKKVYAFDIQQLALDNTSLLLKKNNINNVSLILDSHANILNYVDEKVKAIIFNLGYLPKGDKNITTLASSTIKALKDSLKILDDLGMIGIVIYEGHENGLIESSMIKEYVASLNQKEYDVLQYSFLNQINYPPYLIVIERRKHGNSFSH